MFLLDFFFCEGVYGVTSEIRAGLVLEEGYMEFVYLGNFKNGLERRLWEGKGVLDNFFGGEVCLSLIVIVLVWEGI